MSDPDTPSSLDGRDDSRKCASRPVDQFLPALYEELRRIARRQLRKEPARHTVDTTTLVHEAYIKLARLDRIRWQNRSHFLAAAAGAIRQILVNQAIRRKAAKRGGTRKQVTLNEVMVVAEQRQESVLALDEALHRLAQIEPRWSRVVECRFFAGMSIQETAEALEISPATVTRDWTLARAWLNRELGRPSKGSVDKS